MSASLAGAVKAYLESQALGITVFADVPSAKTALRNPAPPTGDGLLKAPYVVVTGEIGLTLDTLEDGTVITGAEEIQLDLYQSWRDAADNNVESRTLPDAITKALHGSRLKTTGTDLPPKTVYGVLQRHRRRQLDRDERIVRHIYQCDVVRAL